jgi:hypothetical protein
MLPPYEVLLLMRWVVFDMISKATFYYLHHRAGREEATGGRQLRGMPHIDSHFCFGR